MLLFKQSFNRFLISIARGVFPVLHWGKNVFVFRADDIHEVLTRNKDFTIYEINGQNIDRHIGPFILGLDDGPQYQQDMSILRSAVHKDDPENIRGYIRATAHQLAKELPPTFDVISAFTRLIPLRLLGEYFGTPGPSDKKMLYWNRAIFWDVFLDLKNIPEVRQNALKSSEEMNAYLATLIQEQKQLLKEGHTIKDNMLNRLIIQQTTGQSSFDDKALAGNMAGVYMGALEPTSKACVNILQQFFARKKILKLAQEAAKADDVETMGALALEAMRFHPNMPLLMRYCKEEQIIGTKKKRHIKAGKNVFAMTYSAMFDPRSVSKPKKFLPGRDKDMYLYYGFGQHQCFGNYINFISIPEMLVALLKLEGLKPKGKIQFEGPFPDKWELTKT